MTRFRVFTYDDNPRPSRRHPEMSCENMDMAIEAFLAQYPDHIAEGAEIDAIANGITLISFGNGDEGEWQIVEDGDSPVSL